MMLCDKVREIKTKEEFSKIMQSNEDIVCDDNTNDKYDKTSYKIFVLAADKRIKLLQVDGDDGNGWYGTGYSIIVKIKE